MKGTPTSFWAKLEKDDDGHVLSWHPFVDHCADVAAVFEALLEIDTIRARLSRLGGRDDLDATTRARLCVLVALHDLGKPNLGFQAKGRPELGTTAGHVGEAIALLCDGSSQLKAALDPETLMSWGDATGGLLAASICHHGRPNVNDAPPFQETWWKPRHGLDPRAGLSSLVAAAWRWFPRARDTGPALPDGPAFQHAFAGLVMLADWIGSDRHPAMFPYSEEGDPDRIDLARQRACKALETIGIDVARARLTVVGKDPFAAVAPDLAPRAAQSALLASPVPTAGSITVLEAETGSGKTEASLARFVALLGAGRVDGMMFALPTRTAATQIFDRVVTAVAHAFPDDAARPPVVLAVPGYLQVDAEVGKRLAPFEVLWPDRQADRERHRGWAAEQPKRYLAAPVVVGTVDQVLLSGLMVSHAHLRAAALLRHLLVVDEVHASDSYMTRILDAVLRRHMSAGGHALLLSATLGGEARARLLGADVPTLKAAAASAYPLVSSMECGQLAVHSVPHDGRAREVAVDARPIMEDCRAIARLALESALAGGKVIVLRNTVADCLATQVELERIADDRELLFSCEGVVSPHHSRYARDDRGKLDRALEARLGKYRPAGGCIVVATQTVQQSLDLDADLLVTDLCPIDVLLQRVGRLHRHVRARPLGFEDARAIVLVPGDRDLGSLIREDGLAIWRFGIGTVYEDLRVLEATWRLIEREPRWKIPSMCRRLVEQGVHSQVLGQIADEGGPAWRKHGAIVFGGRSGDERMADLNLVEWSKPYDTILFPRDRKIPTRLGEGDRRVVFSKSVQSPLGSWVRDLTVKASWARDVPDDVSEATDVSAHDHGFSFRYGPSTFIYDRFGLRPDLANDPTRAPLAEDDDET